MKDRRFSRDIPAVGHWCYCDDDGAYRLHDGILTARVLLTYRAGGVDVRVAFMTADDYAIEVEIPVAPDVADATHERWCAWLAALAVADHDALEAAGFGPT